MSARRSSILTGVAVAALGAAVTLRPFSTLGALVLLIAATLVVAGVNELLEARDAADPRLGRLTGGLLVLTGIVALALPGRTVGAVAIAIGAGLVLAGIARIAAGVRRHGDDPVVSIVLGGAYVVLGVVALSWPDATLLLLALVAGPAAVILGVVTVVRALRSDRAPRPARAGRVRRIAGAGIAVLCAALLAGVSAFLHDGSPTLDAFSDVASADLPRESGTLIRSGDFGGTVPDGTEVRRILYTTTDADGRRLAASALVVTPKDADGRLPVLLWEHGTTGVVPKCGPSVLAEPFEAGGMPVVATAAKRGWAIVAPDYPGLGAPGRHPYLVGVPAARSALDAVRAARRLDDVDLSDRTVVWGHSQGGGAALWTRVEGPRYAPDVPLAGVAALAPVSDVTAWARGLQDTPAGQLFASFVVQGYANAYDDVRFTDYIRPAAQTIVRRVVGRCLSEPATVLSLAAVLAGQTIFSRDLTSGALGRRLAENVPLDASPVPALIAQGLGDELVLPPLQRAYVKSLCERDQPVVFREVPARDHLSVVAADSPLIPELFKWTADRLAGRPAPPSTCA